MENVQELNYKLYIHTDGEGNITQMLSGTSPVPTEGESGAFFFMISQGIMNNIHKFKVVMNGLSPQLVLKDENDPITEDSPPVAILGDGETTETPALPEETV